MSVWCIHCGEMWKQDNLQKEKKNKKKQQSLWYVIHDCHKQSAPILYLGV